ncbi:hypothetical protein [Pseudonocardia spirodelae]|uniref:YokE-like PH domain-containing protein n=1 Tax=Pseudonocardia spirodelae TaxID=3133431 RepID=A0ABU8T4K3_9PSEU
MTGPVFDERDQLDTVAAALLDGERIVAVYDDRDAGLLGLTDLRVLLRDDALLERRTALTSIPYHRIGTVSAVTDRALPGRAARPGRIAITVGERVHEVALRDAARARHAHDVILRQLLGS